MLFNILHVKKEKIYLAYVSKNNSNREKQVILLMISNGQGQWHYLAVKKSALLRRIIRYSMPAISSFRSIENKPDVYRGNDCMKKFCESLRQHAMSVIIFKMKKMKLLIKERQKSYVNAKICEISKQNFERKY